VFSGIVAPEISKLDAVIDSYVSYEVNHDVVIVVTGCVVVAELALQKFKYWANALSTYCRPSPSRFWSMQVLHCST
jgi:hypothetical protein